MGQAHTRMPYTIEVHKLSAWGGEELIGARRPISHADRYARGPLDLMPYPETTAKG